MGELMKRDGTAAINKSVGSDSVEEWLKAELPGKLAAVLPKHITPDRIVRVALTAMLKTPDLRLCSKASLLQCIIQCSALGIEPDGRRAHLIPYRDKRTGTVICTLIPDYKGIVELVRRGGEVTNIHADVVYENDHFDYSFGSGAKLVHRPSLNRGKALAAYSFVVLRDGSESFEVMSIAEVDGIRKRSKAAYAGPWVSDYAEMAKKTVFRRHSKWLPLSSETRQFVEADDDMIEQQPIAAPVRNLINLNVASQSAEIVDEQKEEKQLHNNENTQNNQQPESAPESITPPHQLEIPEDDSQIEAGAVDEVTEKKGEKNGRKYTKYSIIVNNVAHNTFDTKISENARWYRDNGIAVEAYYVDGKFGRTLVYIKEAQ